MHIFKNDRFQVNLHMRYRFQQLNPGSNAFYEGLDERKQSLDAGLELSLTQKWGQVTLTAVHDTLDRHQGSEVQMSYRYFIDAGSWSLSPYISWTWQDDNLSDYYFGVSEAEARPDRPAYSPGDS
ncbi:MAG: MipA/OmpV family protein [Proteobacteria bacterium]|nr:MipA/OmpV family protein [Pseudomonadota bacterium]